tara:strand:+ start:9933 stop:10112 length:180 start_codon:yes stop_codon:yes gene_type:complete
MYKLVHPFEYDMIYNTDKKTAIKKILKDIKYFDNNLKISIIDIKTGKTYSYIISKSLKL